MNNDTKTLANVKSAAEILAAAEFKLTLPSPEQTAAWQKEDAERAEVKRLNDVKRLIARASLPKRQRELATLDRGGEFGEAESKLRSLSGTGFLAALVGGVGPGKSQLGVELIVHHVETHVQPALFVTLTELFMHLRASFRNDSPKTELEILKEFRRYRLLVIDELSKIAATDWERRMFFELLNKRYEDMTDTLLIANMSASDLIGFIGPALASRMNQTGGIIVCDWPSFRNP
ncbi:MAG: ATP-binding protein [Verrucomicrobia subdivision 3 bacterium]|nr:ATP-binding protein [Limisphaerales bacterium]